MGRASDAAVRLGLFIVLVVMWYLLFYRVVMAVVDIPLWTAGGILAVLGVVALFIGCGAISIVLFIIILS